MVLVQSLRLLTHPGDYRDSEEAYNAAVGYLVWTAGLWDHLVALQNASFCGGCSVVGAMAAPILGLGGDHFLLWKGLAVAWQAATVIAGFFAADRWAGRTAAWLFAAFLAVPPPGLADMALMLWGNHQETSLFVLSALALLDTPVLAALIVGVAVWFCRTAAYGAVVLVPAAVLLQRRPWPILAFAAGLSLLLIPAAAGSDLGYHMGLRENLLPNGPIAALGRGLALLDPLRLARQVYGLTPIAPLWTSLLLLGGITGVAAQVAERRWLPLLPAAFVLLWSISGFDPGRAAALSNARYYAPWVMLLGLSAAAGLGPWLSRDGARRRAAIVLLGGIAAGDLLGAVLSLRRPDWSVFDLPATDLAKLTLVAPARLPLDRVAVTHAVDPRVERVLRRVEGYERAKLGESPAGLTGDVAVGYGVALGESGTIGAHNRLLDTLPPETARPLGLGIARTLVGPSVPPQESSLAAEHRRLTDGASARCWLCAAEGPVLLASCDRRPPREVAACLARGDADALLGAGWVFTFGSSPDRARPVAAALPPSLKDAFEAGLGDPVPAVPMRRQHGQSQ